MTATGSCLAATVAPARADYGKVADVAEARRALLGTFTAFGTDLSQIALAVSVPDVTIASGYALCSFKAGPYGGQMLLQNQRGRWVKLDQTGGIMSIVDLRGLVPAAVATELASHNALTRGNDPFLLGRR